MGTWVSTYFISFEDINGLKNYDDLIRKENRSKSLTFFNFLLLYINKLK